MHDHHAPNRALDRYRRHGTIALEALRRDLDASAGVCATAEEAAAGLIRLNDRGADRELAETLVTLLCARRAQQEVANVVHALDEAGYLMPEPLEGRVEARAEAILVEQYTDKCLALMRGEAPVGL